MVVGFIPSCIHTQTCTTTFKVAQRWCWWNKMTRAGDEIFILLQPSPIYDFFILALCGGFHFYGMPNEWRWSKSPIKQDKHITLWKGCGFNFPMILFWLIADQNWVTLMSQSKRMKAWLCFMYFNRDAITRQTQGHMLWWRSVHYVTLSIPSSLISEWLWL